MKKAREEDDIGKNIIKNYIHMSATDLLYKELYLWNASGGEISQLLSMDEDTSDYITSTAWNQLKGLFYFERTSL